ncbi:MAG TPA: HAMP domain-containing sensor histidine kinase [Acidimicrobiales bacterium]|nr:HAMP domain-containing sensor histidine kinase [Acidimicrobiales bacterium]
MSLRTRLVIAVGVIAVVALVIADIATYSALQSVLYQRIDQQLEQRHVGLERAVNSGRTLRCFGPGQFVPAPGGPGGPGGPNPVQEGTGDANAVQATAIEVRTPAGSLLKGQVCPVYVGSAAYTPSLPASITGFTTNAQGERSTYFTAAASKAGGPSFRVRASTLDNGDLLILAQPLTDTASTLHQLLLIELAVTGGAVLVALVGGFWLVRLGLRPLRDMEITAESIADGNLTERVPGENESTEVGRLARTLNVMLTRIEAAFSARLASERRLRASEQQLRQFVADASHELRTPISAISAYAELFERGASEQKEDLERLLGGIRTETARMEHLVADLLLLARLDEGKPMEQHSVDLVALCAEAVHTSSTVGPDWPVTFEASVPVEVVGDATRLRQVMDNLLANVRAHTPAGTRARVRVEPDDGQVVVTVTDNGPGMDPEESQHVFERFYRSDPSRSRTHGGAGLGLSIVSAIVAAHHGTVAADGRPGSGTTFTVRLPRTPPTAEPVPEDAVVAGP